MSPFWPMLFLTYLFIGQSGFTQQNTELKGFGVYTKYDESFITPDLKGKHSGAIGPAFIMYTPNFVDLIPSIGFQAGYNYIVLKKRKIKASFKDRYREETVFGLGLNASFYREGQFSITASFYKPLIQSYGRLLSWTFLSEYGLGALRGTPPAEEPNKIRFNLNVEIFRLRIGKLPLYLHSNFDYDIQNDFLAKDRINLGISGGLRYYIYKIKP